MVFKHFFSRIVVLTYKSLDSVQLYQKKHIPNLHLRRKVWTWICNWQFCKAFTSIIVCWVSIYSSDCIQSIDVLVWLQITKNYSNIVAVWLWTMKISSWYNRRPYHTIESSFFWKSYIQKSFDRCYKIIDAKAYYKQCVKTGDITANLDGE